MRDSEIKTLFAKADEQVHVDEIRKQKTYYAIIEEMEKQRTPMMSTKNILLHQFWYMDKLFFAVYGVLICLGIIFITALQYTGLNQNGMITVCMVGAGILSITSISVIDKLFFGKMAELGESCYFNTKQCVAAWLVLSGMINVMILFLIAGYLNYHWSVGLLQVGLYILTPYLDKVDKASSKGKILMATVDGDVHDIGKNIVGTVLECNGYEVIDLGVMVPRDKIVEKAKEINADVVTLSGLISPSLKEMERVADLFQKVGMQVPVLIAGAATSKLHTGLKVLPNYDYSLHVTDAMDTITVVSQLLSTKRKDFLETKQNQLRKIAKRYIDNNNETEEKKVFPEVKKTVSYIPKVLGKQFLSLPVEIFKDTLKWDIALYALRVKNTPEEEKTLNDLKKIYEKLIEEKVEFRAAYGYFRCKKTETFLEMEGMTFEVSPNLAQYIEKEDYVGGFVISVGSKIFKDDKYLGLLETLLCNAIAETASEYMETRVSEDIVPTFLRPAVGYPILPDHSLKKVVFDLIDGERTGAKLSPAFAMTPLSTVCGFYLCNDNAKY